MFKALTQKVVSDARAQNRINAFTIPKRSRKEEFKSWLIDKVNNFCKVTSFHGYVHTVKKEYHPIERWLWIVLSFLALTTALILLWISLNWNAETPTMTVIESTNYPTYNLPFPAVTICSMNKISKSAALEIASEM